MKNSHEGVLFCKVSRKTLEKYLDMGLFLGKLLEKYLKNTLKYLIFSWVQPATLLMDEFLFLFYQYRERLNMSVGMKKGIQVCIFINNRLQHRCFPVNIVKFLRTNYFEEYLPITAPVFHEKSTFLNGFLLI